jgi:hypothetical protein
MKLSVKIFEYVLASDHDAAMAAKDAEIADWQKRTEDRAMQLDSALARLMEALIEIARLREGLEKIAADHYDVAGNGTIKAFARALLKGTP